MKPIKVWFLYTLVHVYVLFKCIWMSVLFLGGVTHANMAVCFIEYGTMHVC